MFYRRISRPALLALALVVLVSGCRSNRERDAQLSAPDLLYNRAHELLDNRDYNSAVKLYEALEARFPFHLRFAHPARSFPFTRLRGRLAACMLRQAGIAFRLVQ